MHTEAEKLKTTTVLSADVVGYTAMMAADTPATVTALVAHVREIEAIVRRFSGRVVDAPGDNVLVELAREEDALACAIEVHRALAYMPLPRGVPRLQFRIGLHSGPALERKGRLYGDGVNVAARLQAAAEPDAIWMSEAVAERAPRAHSRTLTELGRRRYKNVPYDVSTYRLVP
jgi:adenylate cyclase